MTIHYQSIRRSATFIAATFAAVLGVLSPAPLHAGLSTRPSDGVGTRAPEWGKHAWLNSPPLTLAQLKGKVVLVRWWTDGCSLCAATAPALNDLHRRCASRGLVVIGMYHPKPPRDETPEAVAGAARKLGFAFPIALDNDWATLRRWWLSTGDRSYTSVTFLIDRQGIIRAVHLGGEFHASTDPEHAECARDYEALQHEVERLLVIPAATGGSARGARGR
jgi:peroxiredoxin